MSTVLEKVKEEARKAGWYKGTDEQRKAYDNLNALINSGKKKEKMEAVKKPAVKKVKSTKKGK